MTPEGSSRFWDTYRAPQSDPRTIITPDAFSVHPDLLGVPLAQHPRRVVAILVDLLLVAVVTQLGGLLLGILAVIFLLRATFRKTGHKRTPTIMETAFRGVVGCFGFIVLLITGIFLTLAVLERTGTRDMVGDAARGATERAVERALERAAIRDDPGAGAWAVAAALGEGHRFRQAQTEEEAREWARALAARGAQFGLTLDEVYDELRDIAPRDAPWRDRIQEWVLEPAYRGVQTVDTVPLAERIPLEALEELLPELLPGLLPDPEGDPLAERLAEEVPEAAVREPEPSPDPEPSPEPAPALDLSPELTDTLRALELRLEEERARRIRAQEAEDQARQELRAARQEADEASRFPGIRAVLRRIADDLGVGFGWAALYFTVFTTWWKGRTPGKRLVRIRVVKLSGEPLTWWDSFERYGGYAAGFATGLLGFLQVYWDPNRQAIHDRIGKTVVIQDGKPPVPGRWRAAATSSAQTSSAQTPPRS